MLTFFQTGRNFNFSKNYYYYHHYINFKLINNYYNKDYYLKNLTKKKNNSYSTSTTVVNNSNSNNQKPCIQPDFSIDYLIIGSGVVGLAIANRLSLTRKNKKILLIEKNDRLGEETR